MVARDELLERSERGTFLDRPVELRERKLVALGIEFRR